MTEKGLTEEEVKNLRKQYGRNVIVGEKKENFLIKIIHIICEPMFLLLGTVSFQLPAPSKTTPSLPPVASSKTAFAITFCTAPNALYGKLAIKQLEAKTNWVRRRMNYSP